MSIVRGTTLTRAQLELARDELRVLLDAYPQHVDTVLAAVRTGKINGSLYIDTENDCACLIGWFSTAANRGTERVKAVVERWIRSLMVSDYQRYCERAPTWWAATDIEVLIQQIRPGQKPRDRVALRLVEQWIVEWQQERAHAALPAAL
jgi:hypothetical protein